MSRDLNLCQFIGRLGQEPEVRYLPNGDAVANISIAVGDDYKDKSGNKVEQTEWVRVTAFRGQAEIIGKYLKKGSQVYVSGKMKTRKWQAQDGPDRYSTEIVASEMQMLDSRGGAQGGGDYQQSSNQQSSNQQSAPQQGQNAPQQAPQGMDSFDDSTPF
ncbi:single-stranded DNA-binding protein [Porticoccaceae bacterium]|nr:single-stranded DNA-binding protein [Porticoccaceae bacterium]